MKSGILPKLGGSCFRRNLTCFCSLAKIPAKPGQTSFSLYSSTKAHATAQKSACVVGSYLWIRSSGAKNVKVPLTKPTPLVSKLESIFLDFADPRSHIFTATSELTNFTIIFEGFISL